MPAVVVDLQKELDTSVNCYIDGTDPQTVVFAYNRSFNDNSILPVIRLEIGTLAAWTPAEEKPITPYAAKEYPKLFNESSTNILTVLPKRTFWEKVTILHREAYRPEVFQLSIIFLQGCARLVKNTLFLGTEGYR